MRKKRGRKPWTDHYVKEIAEFLLPTPDDWAPNFPDPNLHDDDHHGMAQVLASEVHRGRTLWRLSVWGLDDTGLGMWYDDEEVFRRDLVWLSRMPFVDQAMLLDRGFSNN